MFFFILIGEQLIEFGFVQLKKFKLIAINFSKKSTSNMIWKRFSQLLLSILLTIYTCHGSQISFIELISTDTLVIKTIQAKSAEFIWLLQVRQNSSTINKKVFSRSVYNNFSTAYPQSSKLEDVNNELELKAYDPTLLKCALFYNKTDQKYFVYRFSQGMMGSQLINLSQQMTVQKSNQSGQNSFKVSTSCEKVMINELDLYIYNLHVNYNYGTLKNESMFVWDLVASFEGYDIIGTDQNLNSIVTTQEVFLLAKQSVYKYYLDTITQTYMDQSYTLFQYLYATNVDLMDFKQSTAVVKYLVFTEGMYSEEYQRIIIFASKANGSIYNYALVGVVSSEDAGASVISTTTGQSLGQPQFVSSELLSMVIVYGNSTLGIPFYEGYYFDIVKEEVSSITFPPSITNYNNYLVINQYFVYARNKNIPQDNKGNHSAYIFTQGHLYSYFEQQIIQQSQFNSNWANAFIQSPNYNQKFNFLFINTIIYNLHSFANKYYFMATNVGSFAVMEAKQYSFLEYNLIVNSNPVSAVQLISSADTDFRWIYAIQNKTTNSSNVYIETYNTTTKNTTHASLTLNNKTQFSFQTYMHTPNIDCFFIENTTKSALQFYRFNGSTIEYLADIVSDLFPAHFPTSKDTNAEKNIQIASSCQVVRVLNKTYSLIKTTTPHSFEETPNSPLNLTKAVFDNSLMFAIQDTELYKYNGQTYEKILTSDFKSLNELISNSDGTKVMVRTSQKKEETVTNSTTNKNTTKTYFSFQMKVFSSTVDGWKEITTDNQLTLNIKISTNLSSLNVSTSFDKGFFCYTRSDTTPKNECLFKIVDYTSSKAYESVYQLDSGKYPRTINFGEKFIYLVEGEDLTRKKVTRMINCKDQILTVVNNSVSLASSSEVECSLYEQGFIKSKVYESSADSSFSMVFEYLNVNKVSLVRTPSKTPDIIKSQLALKGNNRGFFYQNGSFYQCTPGCLSCFNSYHCTKCVSGYSLSLENYKCIKCNGYCDSCNVANTGQCFTCPLGFYFDKNQLICIKCNSNCVTCTGRSQTMCITCKLGYFLNDNIQKKKKQTCLTCPDYCDHCQNSTNCTLCQYGYSVSTNGTCVKCPLDCNACDATNVSNCISCRNGSELVILDGRKMCKKCPSYCETCTNEVCSTPRTGYTLDAVANVCYENCRNPCKECSRNSSSSCTSCMPGYKLRGTVCQPDTSCNNNLTCIACPSGYFLIANKCYACDLTTYCSECQSNDPTICVGCTEGFYLLNSTCQLCSSDCIKCYAANICQKCKDGYLLSQTEQGFSVCIICVSNCKTCIESSTNCKSCLEGFQLVGSSCVSSNVISFMFKVNLDIASFTNDIYNQIIQQLSSISSKSSNAVTITSIKSGSVIVSGSINVNDTNDESATLSAFDSALSPGSTIAGLQIQQSQFVGYTPETMVSSSSSGSNLVMILAIVIPGAVMVICLFGLLIYKKFFAPKELDPVRQQSDRSSETDFQEKVVKKQSKNMPQKKSKNGFMPKIKRKLPTQNN